jgi:hydrogenase expression/formation protein HypC
MCVGVPMKVIGSEGIAATCTDGERIELIDLSLVGDVPAGTWLLTFLGTARDIISADEAEKISAALNGLRSIMQGGDLGDAFADLNAREPQLPPHLAAALADGKSTA